MRIRTRYKLFKVIIGLAILTFLLSLYDIFANDSAWFIFVMIVYVVLAVAALILYIGRKPRLDEEEGTMAAVAARAPMEPQDIAGEIPRPLRSNVKGPHHFRCPFCSNIFALELTHLQKQHEMRMDCPFCSNTIRIPARPKLSPGEPVDMTAVERAEQALFVCGNCGETLRYTAPGQRAEERARVYSCPHCGSDRVDPAVGAVA